MAATWIDDQIRNDPSFACRLAEEGAIVDATSVIARLMEDRGVTVPQLARRLGMDVAAVTKLLEGPGTLTLRQVARALFALGARLELRAGPLTGAVARMVPADRSRPKRVAQRR